MKIDISQIQNVSKLYGLELMEVETINTGHINNTYKIRTDSQSYILQRINPRVFPFAHRIVNNESLIRKHFDDLGLHSFFVEIHKTLNGDLFQFTDGAHWRLTTYISGSHSPLYISNERMAFNLGKKLREFHLHTQSANISQYEEVIPDFHNLNVRYRQYTEARNAFPYEMSDEILSLIEKVNQFLWLKEWFEDLISDRQLTLRLCHNDTKISNTLVNDITGEIDHLIDLDTVMPGYLFYDIGDAVRAGCSKSDESEIIPDKVVFEETYFHSILKGYFSDQSNSVNIKDSTIMVNGSMVMLYMQALRFITDHFLGNIYFKINFEGQNLIRARNQLILLDQLYHYSKTNLII